MINKKAFNNQSKNKSDFTVKILMEVFQKFKLWKHK